jgi:transcriptional regulator with XRE-family HTH domain
VTTPSNEAIGQQLGVSHATVSRYKSGDRFPELDVMAKIAELFDWTMDDQYKARQTGTFADEFNRRVRGMANSDSLGAVVQAPSAHQ